MFVIFASVKYKQPKPKKMKLTELTEIVSNVLDIPNEIMSKSQEHKYARARFMCLALYKRIHFGVSGDSLSEVFDKDHSTISYMINRHRENISKSPTYLSQYHTCCEFIGLNKTDNTQIDRTKLLNHLQSEVNRLTKERDKLKMSLSMIIRCTDEVGNILK